MRTLASFIIVDLIERTSIVISSRGYNRIRSQSTCGWHWSHRSVRPDSLRPMDQMILVLSLTTNCLLHGMPDGELILPLVLTTNVIYFAAVDKKGGSQ